METKKKYEKRVFIEGVGNYTCDGCPKSVNKIYHINGKKYCTKCYTKNIGGLKK